MPLSQPSPRMRVLGTQLPTSQTVHDRVFGPAPRGRPVVIAPKNLALKKDASRPQNFRLLWQKIQPDAITRAQELMDTHGGSMMPPALRPKALSAYEAKKHRREH